MLNFTFMRILREYLLTNIIHKFFMIEFLFYLNVYFYKFSMHWNVTICF